MVRRETVIATIKRNAQFAARGVPWLLVVLGLLGRVDFSKPVWVIETAAISWVAFAVVGVLFDAAVYALQRGYRRVLGRR